MKIILAVWLLWWAAAFLPPIFVRVPLFGMAGAMTIAPFVLVDPSNPLPEWVVRHEKRHIFQQRVLSPAVMLILYFIFSAVIFVKSFCKHLDFIRAWNEAYFYNPFEIDARRNGGWYTKEW